jgi:hypothetical protein
MAPSLPFGDGDERLPPGFGSATVGATSTALPLRFGGEAASDRPLERVHTQACLAFGLGENQV